MTTNTVTKADVEALRDDLDAKALRLTNYKHTWTNDQRAAYQRASASLAEAIRDPDSTLTSPAFVESLTTRHGVALAALDEALKAYEGGRTPGAVVEAEASVKPSEMP